MEWISKDSLCKAVIQEHLGPFLDSTAAAATVRIRTAS